jgi:hypothetical protein
MHPAAHHPLPTAEDFALVDNRYVAVPAALWAVVTLAVIVSALFAPAPAPALSATPAEDTAIQVLGA